MTRYAGLKIRDERIGTVVSIYFSCSLDIPGSVKSLKHSIFKHNP